MDIFRKLGAGAKFDFQRFRQDAQKLKIIKTDTSHNTKSLDFFGTNQNESAPEPSSVEKVSPTTQNETVKEPGKKRKRKLDDEIEDDSNEESESDGEYTELQLLGSLRSDIKGDKSNVKRKKKKKKVSASKLKEQHQEKINHFRNQHKINVYGTDIPDPVESFQQLCDEHVFSSKIIENISESGYKAPTPIQMQAVPVMLAGRDIMACAPTGSGKTAAFLLPILHQLKGPRKLGFRALVLAPTRELAQQTYRECLRLSEGLGFRVHIIEKAETARKKFGRKTSQKFDILITTPNRLVYLIQQEPPVISLKNIEWLVIDESDKLFEEGKLGFREQLGAIYKACDGPSVRRAMFSATFAHDVEEWCKLHLDNVVQVYIGARNSAQNTIQQELVFCGSESGKLYAFRNIIQKGFEPPVLVFVQSKERAKELFHELIYDGVNVDVIHADRTQKQRDNVVKSFRSGHIWVLICTELMGRGIDFKGVNLVINYDFPNSAVGYIHRIGRTGRAGRSGRAVTFFTENDSVLLRSIANVMKEAGCPVPEYMLKINKPNKKQKRQMSQTNPDRKTIRTVLKEEIMKSRLKRQNMNKRKFKERQQSQKTKTSQT
ncbi:unnamed protein product [Owenia fusiformis]|uniref:Probable ATP-dependent RNA helicase DDX52 n=1 Tax=Owenia fusiformis TaxID=6347 RepID=A0A8J1UYR5_OWEFU|nr:unnamed protein product [Owenia fusiformis]